jgi:hypothetical protein
MLSGIALSPGNPEPILAVGPLPTGPRQPILQSFYWTARQSADRLQIAAGFWRRTMHQR